MRKMIKYPAWEHLKNLPDNITILSSNNADYLVGLIEREYYWPAMKFNGHDSLRAICSLRMMYKEEREKNIALSKENSKLKRR